MMATRTGYHLLYAGAGYSGSCFPKDVKALISTGRNAAVELKVLQAVEQANERRKNVLVDMVVQRFGENLAGRQFGIWGLAFKPNTDDMREAPSRVVIPELLRRGATIRPTTPQGDERGTARLARGDRRTKSERTGTDAIVRN